MTIGPDIKEAIVEVGLAYTIIRDSGNVAGNYLTAKPNEQVTKPFIREFFLEAQITYDSPMIAGDIIEFDTTGDRYVVMHFTPTLFENVIIRYESVLYKTNVKVSILRPGERRNPNTYVMETYWDIIKQDIDLLLTTPLFGQDLETAEELGLLGIETHEIWCPSSYGIQHLDRIRITSGIGAGNYWRAEAVRKYRFEACDVVKVGEDVRPTTTSSTTSTTSSSTTTTTA
jgi:hypothetical protein